MKIVVNDGLTPKLNSSKSDSACQSFSFLKPLTIYPVSISCAKLSDLLHLSKQRGIELELIFP